MPAETLAVQNLAAQNLTTQNLTAPNPAAQTRAAGALPGETSDGPRHARGLLDTNVLILRRWIDPQELPAEVAISAVTLAELSAGPHLVLLGEHAGSAEEFAERARRLDVLQRAESEFDPIPFDAEAARLYGRACAAVAAHGRRPRRRTADLMIAATAAAAGLALYTTNPRDYAGLRDLVTVVPLRQRSASDPLPASSWEGSPS